VTDIAEGEKMRIVVSLGMDDDKAAISRGTCSLGDWRKLWALP
jgi:hypothetical protein